MAVPASAPSTPSAEHAEGHEEEPEGFFAENLIRLDTLRTSAKVLALTATALLVGAALFIATAPAPAAAGQAAVSFEVSEAGLLGTAASSIAGSAVTALEVLLAAALALVLTGTMHAKFDGVFWAGPVAFSLFAVYFMRSIGAALVLAPVVIALWVIFGMARSRGAIAADGDGDGERLLSPAWTCLVVACVAGFIVLAQWRLGESELTTLLFLRIRLGVEWLLIPALILAGSDFGEMADAVAGTVVDRLGASVAWKAWLWTLIPVVLAGLLVVRAVAAAATWLLDLLPFAAGVIGYAVLLARRARLRPGIVRHPHWGLVTAVGVVAGLNVAPALLDYNNGVIALGSDWGALAFFVGFPASWFALRRGWLADSDSDFAGIVLHLLAIFAFTFMLGFALTAGHLAHAPLTFPGLLTVMTGLFGCAVIAAIGWLLARRTPAQALVAAAQGMTRALAGVMILLLIDRLFAAAASASDRFSKAQAVIVFVALLWDAAVSGAITNKTGAVFPRHTRVALFGAYVLTVAAAVLLLSPLRASGFAVERQSFTPELYPQYGILMLALPVLAGLALPPFLGALRGTDRNPVATSETTSPSAASESGAPTGGRGIGRWLGRLTARRVVALALLVAVWWVVMTRSLYADIGPGIPAGWSTSWSTDGSYSLSYPPSWVPVLADGWDITVYAPGGRNYYPIQVDARLLGVPPTASTSRLLAAVAPGLAPSSAHWTAVRLPEGPALFLVTNWTSPVNRQEYVVNVACIVHEGRVYELLFTSPLAQYSALGQTPAKIFLALYFPS